MKSQVINLESQVIRFESWVTS